MKIMTVLPAEYQNVLITYVGQIRVNGYGETKAGIVTRRAFYTKSDGYYDSKNNFISIPGGWFCVPQYWKRQHFINGGSALLPRGLFSYGNVLPDHIISWEFDK